GECRDADRAHARSPLGSLRPKKKPPDLSGPVAFPSVGGVYGLRWEFASSRRKATGPNRGALRSPRAPAGTAHGVVRHLAVAHQEQMTRRRAQHLSLPSAAPYLHGRRSPLQGIRFHARRGPRRHGPNRGSADWEAGSTPGRWRGDAVAATFECAARDVTAGEPGPSGARAGAATA